MTASTLSNFGAGTPGPAGPEGPAGATGATGATGPAGPGSQYFQVQMPFRLWADSQYGGVGHVPKGEAGNIVEISISKEVSNGQSIPLFIRVGSTQLSYWFPWEGDPGDQPDPYPMLNIPVTAGASVHTYTISPPLSVVEYETILVQGGSDILFDGFAVITIQRNA